MKLGESRITAQGQTSVPAEVRKRLEIVPGSVLEWSAEGGRITVRRVGRYTCEAIHRKLFPQEPEPRSLDELEEGKRQYVRARHRPGVDIDLPADEIASLAREGRRPA